MQPRPRHFAVIGLLGAIFGSSFFLIAVALRDLPPFTVAAARLIVAAAAMLAVAAAFGQKLPRDRRSWRAFLALGALGASLPFVLLATGQTMIDSGIAAILISAVPLFTLVLAPLLSDERADGRKFAGVAVGFAGVVLLLAPGATGGAGVLGGLCVLGTAFCYAANNVLMRRWRLEAPLAVAAGSLLCAAILVVPLALWHDRPWTLSPGAGPIAAIVLMGLFPTGLAQLLLLYLNAGPGPSFTALTNFIAPAVGVALGIAVLGERPGWTAFAALGAIFAGIALTSWGIRRAARR